MSETLGPQPEKFDQFGVGKFEDAEHQAHFDAVKAEIAALEKYKNDIVEALDSYNGPDMSVVDGLKSNLEKVKQAINGLDDQIRSLNENQNVITDLEKKHNMPLSVDAPVEPEDADFDPNFKG